MAKTGTTDFITPLAEGNINLIGQFGVGFYSSFIIADHVDVISRVENGTANKWSSDGNG